LVKKTLVLKVDSRSPDISKVRLAADFIKKGGLVAFPTETVYGLGADALNSEAVLALFEAKRRPLDNPPIVHVADVETAKKLTEDFSPKAETLMKKFWPGPLTLIFRRSEIVPSVTVAGLDTVAVRMPRNNVALALIRESGCPVAAPSANLAGKPSPTCAEHVLDDLDGRIDVVLDGGCTRVGVESTVLDLTVCPPEVLRPGGVSFEVLREVLDKVVLSAVAVADREVVLERVRSPGVRHKHYAPDAEVVVVEGELAGIVGKVRELVKLYKGKGCRVGVLASDETCGGYGADVVRSVGSRGDLEGVARSLFRVLREFDVEKVDVVVAEGFPLEGLGLAVMNRLRRAAGYKIVRA
jgi:L-threonylcarbamoyladenylate synthase